MRHVAVVGLLLLAGCEFTSDPTFGATLDGDRILSHIQVLADDSLLGRRSASDDEWKAAAYIRERLQEYGLVAGAPEYFQEFLAFGDSQRRSQNVIGLVPGRGALADEWIVVGAHYDHVGWEDVDPPVRPDCRGGSLTAPCKGADDNASGTALMLDLARAVAEDAAASAGADLRGVMFQAYGAEEIGLVGSRHFCEHPTVATGSIVAMLNLDMVGRLRDDVLTAFAVGSSATWPEVLAEANTDGLVLQLDPTVRANSDHYCFAVSGVPAVFLHTGTHEQYHTPLDDVDLINVGGMLRVGGLALRALRELMVREEPLPYAFWQIAPGDVG